MILPPDTMITVEAKIREAAHVANRATLAIYTMVGGILVFGLASLLEMVMGRHIGLKVYGFFALFLAPVPWMGIKVARWIRASKELSLLLSEDAGDVCKSFSPAMIGPLLDILGGEIDAVNDRKIPAALLRDLLFSVREEDRIVLTPQQRRSLYKMVKQIEPNFVVHAQNDTRLSIEDNALSAAALRALGVLGLSSSIPVLERFARKTDSPPLRESALRSIEQIRARLRYGSEQMLRPSSEPARPDTLLRPVSTDKSQVRDPQHLPRIVDCEEQGKL